MSDTKQIRMSVKSKQANATVFDNFDEESDVLTVDLQQPSLFPKVLELLGGKNAGDEFELELAPEDGFGNYDENAVRALPLSEIPEEARVVGAPLGFEIEGQVYEFSIKAIENDQAMIDMNHPLAGHTLNVAVKVIA